ncbi:hypothetical protein Afil01_08950 [Actinorhabdospora filicis]|uniref:Uncharacterized protein n=1 Tax=Actinorhabdospora filicis TaxID=1785913 RepID=A0A9W6W7M2_9ACTN|nr:hypothetical protein Afil01_08950 [Actinorhabdospora filicis]
MRRDDHEVPVPDKRHDLGEERGGELLGLVVDGVADRIGHPRRHTAALQPVEVGEEPADAFVDGGDGAELEVGDPPTREYQRVQIILMRKEADQC